MTRYTPLALPLIVAAFACASAQTPNPAPSPAEPRDAMAMRAEAACPALLRFEATDQRQSCACLAQTITSPDMSDTDADKITAKMTKPKIVYNAVVRNLRFELSDAAIAALDACTKK